MTARLLIVEDDTTLRVTLQRFLVRSGYAVRTAPDAETALQLVQAQPADVALVDLNLPGMNGLGLIERLHAQGDDTVPVVMTAYPEVRTAVAALKAGAYDYIHKPFDLVELAGLVERAVEVRQLRHEVAWRRVASDVLVDEPLVGTSPAFRALHAQALRLAAASDMPILISGESGVGKDHVARALHRFSARRHGPWVTLDCAVGGADFEGLLFGREATPQAVAQRGLVELAEGGTLLLGEIGDLAMDLQPKLLRLLETQRFRRVGAVRDQHAHVRFIALTHHDLAAAAAQGRFRPDLYYRLEVGRLDIPPLRERPQDVAVLASHFMGTIAQRLRRRPLLIDDAVQARLAAYPWPGNARELRNVVERMLILSRDEGCAADVLHAALPAGSSALPEEPPTAPGWRLADVELHHIRRAMQHCQGNKTKAAELLGISRLTLRQRLKDAEPD